MRYRFADIVYDDQKRELTRDGSPIVVQPQVLAVIAFLIEHRERVVAKDELLRSVWTDAHVTEGSLQRAISLARQALGPGEFIRTQPKIGYRFVADVHTDAPTAPFQPRYVMSGDVHVAYQVFGSAAAGPDVVIIQGWAFPMTAALELELLASLFRQLEAYGRVVMFDKRGTGMSDRVKDLPGLDERMDDLRAVLDDIGSSSAVLVGVSEGASLAIAFAAAEPERTRGLVLVGGFARMARGAGYPHGWAASDVERLKGYVRRAWGSGATITAAVRRIADSPGTLAWAARAEQAGASPGAALDLLEMNLAIDVRELLPAITVPTTVIHYEQDPVIPFENGRFLAERIEGARLVAVPGEDHLFYGEHSAPFIEAVARLAKPRTAE